MYSGRLSNSLRVSRVRSVVLRSSLRHQPLRALVCAPKFTREHSSPLPSFTTVRHFSAETTNNDNQDKEKKSEVAKKSSKTDYGTMAKDMLRSGAWSTFMFFRHPTQIPMKMKYAWSVIKEEAHHYHLGFKLLIADVRTAKGIIFRILEGHSMTRRERLQLMRTVTDLARLVPFSIFILIPFMELLLPVAIKMFPNMLPSTFEDSLKREENLKNELNMRLSVASFFIDTIKSMAEQKKKKSKGGPDDESKEVSKENASATELIEFMEKARMGEPLPHEAVVRIARLFKDELTLANMPRPQLVTMCQFMNLPPFGSDSFLRFQLRTKLNSIKEDDKRILWEGVESLSAQELKDACRERGMRATGLNTFGYRKQINEWLDLSMQKQTPISLLIMSRAFILNLSKENRQLKYEESLQTSISSMDEDVVNEVIVQSASAKEVNTVDMKKRKLESLQFQNEMIEEELEMEREYKRMEEKSTDSSTKEYEKEDTVVGIGDKHRVVDIDQQYPESMTASPSHDSLPFDKKFITIAEGSKFEGDVCVNIAEPEMSTEEIEKIALAKHKSGAPLTASEVQALGDMALQSAVEREKDELAKLKNQIKELKLEKKKKEKEEQASKDSADDLQQMNVSVDSEDILTEFDKETAEKVLEMEENTDAVSSEGNREVQEELIDSDHVHRQDSSLHFEEKEGEIAQLKGTDTSDEISERIDEITLEQPQVVDSSISKDVEDDDDEDEEDEEEDVSLMRMQSLVDGMMSRLEVRLTKTESVLGDKLHKLDVDRDGVLDTEELKSAVMQLLRRHSQAGEKSSEEAADLIKLLDQDNDGRITVKELMEYVASRDVETEEESKMFEAQKPKDRESFPDDSLPTKE